MTAHDLITASLKSIGVIAAGETASAEDAADGLSRLNDLMDAFSTERLTIYEVVRTTKTLTAGTASYSIRSGGDINIVRPVWIERAGLIQDINADPQTEQPIRVLTDQEWARVAQKDFDSTYVQGIYYTHGWSAGERSLIYVYPVPTTSTTALVLYTPGVATGEFADLTTDYTFPQGYRRFFRTALALELAPEFAAPISPELREQARDARANVKRANVRFAELGIDAALRSTGSLLHRSRFDAGEF